MATILTHGGAAPVIAPTARVAPNATLCGDVTVGPNCSIGFGAVLAAESGPVVLGANCVVMDTAVVRGVRGNPARLGDNVLVGPRAYLTGCTIAENVFLATGATVFNGARVGARAEVRINGVVHLRTALPEDAAVPLGWIAVGDPAELFSPDRHEELWEVQRHLDFPGTVYGVPRGTPMRTIMARQVEFYGAHRADWVVDGGHPST
jgi:carbonic anhydrase/acetyltransferase-like protein (isoleucine patch superfamily)